MRQVTTSQDDELFGIFKRIILDRWIHDSIENHTKLSSPPSQLMADDSVEDIQKSLDATMEELNKLISDTPFFAIGLSLLNRSFSDLYIETPLSFACSFPKIPDVSGTDGGHKYEILEDGRRTGDLILSIGNRGVYSTLEVYPHSDSITVKRCTFRQRLPAKKLEELARRDGAYETWVKNLQQAGYVLTGEYRYVGGDFPVGYVSVNYHNELQLRHPTDYELEDILHDRPDEVEISDNFNGWQAMLEDGRKFHPLRSLFKRHRDIRYTESFE